LKPVLVFAGLAERHGIAEGDAKGTEAIPRDGNAPTSFPRFSFVRNGSACQTASQSRDIKISPSTEMMVSITDQVLIV
jgi:hypothetical protein